jgi:hypothetical protein
MKKTWETYLIVCATNEVLIDRENDFDDAVKIANKWAAAGYEIKVIHHIVDLTTFEVEKIELYFEKRD